MTVYNSLFYAILIGFFDLLINPHVKTYILLHFLRIRYFHLVNIAFNQISFRSKLGSHHKWPRSSIAFKKGLVLHKPIYTSKGYNEKQS